MQTHQTLKKIIIILCVLIPVVFVAYYFVYSDIKDKNEHISSLQGDLSFQNNKQGYISATDSYLKSIESDIAHINGSIVPKDGDVKFIEDLESMARSDGLSINIDSLVIVDPSTKMASSTTLILTVKAKTTGSWVGTYTFLSQVESMPVKAKVNTFGLSDVISDVSVDPNNPIKSNDKWQTTFEINVLKYK
jgi:Tfp pilus assembly protein PilO